MDFPWISHGFPTGHMRRGGRGLIDTALRQNVHVFHGLAQRDAALKAMGEVQLGGSIYTWVNGGSYCIVVMMMVNDDSMMMVIIWLMMVNNNLIGGIPTYPSEKYESQLG